LAFEHGELLAEGQVFQTEPVAGQDESPKVSKHGHHKQKHALILTDRNYLIQHTNGILMTDRKRFWPGNRKKCHKLRHNHRKTKQKGGE
jgi:hypothetical protein